jgi:hypothetical protein
MTALLDHLKPRQKGNGDATCIASCHDQLEDIQPKITSPSDKGILVSSTRRNTNMAFRVRLRETIVLNNDSSTCSFRLKIPKADRNLVLLHYYLSSTQLTSEQTTPVQSRHPAVFLLQAWQEDQKLLANVTFPGM